MDMASRGAVTLVTILRAPPPLEHFSSEVVPVRVKKNASKQKIRAHGLTQSGREML